MIVSVFPVFFVISLYSSLGGHFLGRDIFIGAFLAFYALCALYFASRRYSPFQQPLSKSRYGVLLSIEQACFVDVIFRSYNQLMRYSIVFACKSLFVNVTLNIAVKSFPNLNQTPSDSSLEPVMDTNLTLLNPLHILSRSRRERVRARWLDNGSAPDITDFRVPVDIHSSI